MNNINPKNTNHRTKTRTKTIQPYSRHSHKKTNTKKNINKHQNKEKEEEKKGEINKNGNILKDAMKIWRTITFYWSSHRSKKGFRNRPLTI